MRFEVSIDNPDFIETSLNKISVSPALKFYAMQMKHMLTKALAIFVESISGAFNIADGLQGHGQGFSTTIPTTTLAGKTGTSIRSIVQDF